MAFNKLFVIVPVMLAVRKLDGEDPTTVHWLRVVYFSVQGVVLALVAYTYIQATAAASAMEGRVVYVPPAPTPFADPNAKKKYTETPYSVYIVSQARSLLGSTLFGILLTAGLHYYRGMVVGLAMQAVMAPFNLIENVLFKAVILGKGIRPEDKIFKEKSATELTPDDEVVDVNGDSVVRSIPGGESNKSFEDILLDTWDASGKADLEVLMNAINKKNCNSKTKENGWTPLMILAGLGVKGTVSAIRQVKELGGNPAITDGEGWNAMHWAAFHGSADAAKALRDDGKLYLVKDNEGKTALDLARAENNEDVVKVLEPLVDESADHNPNDGLRKRK